MKRAWIVTAIFALGFMILGGFYMGVSKNQILRVAFPSKQPAVSYEPANIQLDYEYIFLENIYSPLVEINSKGELTPGVAEKADWVGDELRLMIREGLKTISGLPISADDVVFSLKRVLVLAGNTHGNFRDLVCPGLDLKSVDDPCPGIRQDGRFVFLKTPRHKSFVRPMLAAIDFAVIPKSSIDPKTLKIVNMKDTSGPYYVESDDGKGNIKLKLNPTHYHAEPEVASEINLIPTDSNVKGDSLKLYESGKVDLLTTVDAARADELIPFSRGRSDSRLHSTLNIRSFILTFTQKGIEKFTEKERLSIGAKMKLAFAEIFANQPGYEQRDEFFPAQAEGSLSRDQRYQLAESYKTVAVSNEKKIKIQFIKRGSIDQWALRVQKHLPDAICYSDLRLPDLTPNMLAADIPDAVVASTDTGFMEDISLISYSMNAGLLGLRPSERANWLAEYMAIDDKSIRINKLQALHMNALKEGVLVPLMSSPYTALIRKPWKSELSELYANNQLWLIKNH